jgi:hypothetical protein
MTVSKVSHPVLPDDPQASLRLELVGQLVAAQFALEGALAEFTGNSGALGQAQLQLSMLVALRQQIGTASPASLSAMSNEIFGAVAQAQGIIQQGRANLANSEASSASNTAKARQALQSMADDLFGKKLLDPYLHFASAEEEAAYRKREQERSIAYDDEIAKQTAEGNRRAASILQSQLADAKAHGANRSPDMAAIEQQLGDLIIISSATLLLTLAVRRFFLGGCEVQIGIKQFLAEQVVCHRLQRLPRFGGVAGAARLAIGEIGAPLLNNALGLGHSGNNLVAHGR